MNGEEKEPMEALKIWFSLMVRSIIQIDKIRFQSNGKRDRTELGRI